MTYLLRATSLFSAGGVIPNDVTADYTVSQHPFCSSYMFGSTSGFAVEALDHCFSTAEPRPGAGPWHQLYRTARGSPAICHFSFLSNFHE